MSGKRANIFGQGKPERPYEEREDESEVPQRATAAQMASRKIKTAKPLKRPTSSLSSFPASGFAVGDSAANAPTNSFPPAQSPAPSNPFANSSFPAFGGAGSNNNNNSLFNFGAQSSQSGSAATNSFSPAQSPAPSNPFATSSFPAFGGVNNSTQFNFGAQSSQSGNAPGSSSAATNSFPPAQSSAPSNPFANSSFPAFGGASSNNSSSLFNFGAQSSQGGNAFGGSSATTNNFPPAQSSAPSNSFATSSAPPVSFGFSGGDSNIFNFSPQTSKSGNAPSTQTSAIKSITDAAVPASSDSGANKSDLFNSTPQTSLGGTLFGGSSAATPAPSSAPSNAFAALSASPAFGANNQNAGAFSPQPPSSSVFNFSAASPAPSNPFGASAPAPDVNGTGFTGSIFNTPSAQSKPAFGGLQQTNNNNGGFQFGATSSSAPSSESTAALTQSQPAFGSLQQNSNKTGGFQFGATSSSASSSESTTAPPLFGTSSPPTSNIESTQATASTSLPATTSTQSTTPTMTATPQIPFGGFKTQPTAPAESAKVQNSFGSSNTQITALPTTTATQSVFSGFQTQPTAPAATTAAQSPFGGSKTQLTAPPAAIPNNSLGGFKTQPTAPAETTKIQNPFGGFSSNMQSTTPAETAKAHTPSRDPGSSMQSTEPAVRAGDAATPTLADVPNIPRALPPKTWKSTPYTVPDTQDVGVLHQTITDLTNEVAILNTGFLIKLNKIKKTQVLAHWYPLTEWHYNRSTDIKKALDIARKRIAAAKGITGNETVATKRKVNEEMSPDTHNATPSKRARSGDSASTPTPIPASETSKVFGSIMNNKNSTSTASNNVFGAKTPEKTSEPAKNMPTLTGFASTPSASSSTENSKSSNAFGFTPKTTSNVSPSTSGGLFSQFGKGPEKTSEPATSTPAVTGFVPTASASNSTETSKAPMFGFPPKVASNSGAFTGGGFTPKLASNNDASTGGSFFSQFAKTAKTYEQLKAERKKKAMDEDYDSDEETKEEWSARWEKEEAARQAAQDTATKTAPGFIPVASSKESDIPSNPFAPLSKAPSGASTPALFGSRVGSPAPSTTGGLSVFDAAGSTGQGPSSNIFAHLSSAPSSNDQDDESDEERIGGTAGKSHSKRKLAESDTESDDAHEGFAPKKQDTAEAKGSLLSRMTKADDAEKDASEKENGSNTPFSFAQTNGTQTPSRVFAPFDFQGAGATTSPKPISFGGDQTYKDGSPIVFSQSSAGKTAPLFQFQPATPSPAEFGSTTPTKPPPANTFSFLQPIANQSGPSSIAGSVLSSRATTPLSEAESGKDEENKDGDEDEGSKSQLDLSQLTDDEVDKNEVIFHTEQAIAKQQVTKSDGIKAWENFARGPLWILKDKVTGKAFVRMRISSGATPLNYALLPKLHTKVSGASKKMVSAVRPGKDGKLSNVFYAVKSQEVAEEFSQKYNDCLPSN